MKYIVKVLKLIYLDPRFLSGDGAGRGLVGRLLFTVIVLAATAFAIWYSQYYIASFLSVSVVTTIDTTTAPLADVRYPHNYSHISVYVRTYVWKKG